MNASGLRIGAGLYLFAALASLLALHIGSPDLAITWSHAHLRWPWLAGLLAIALPLALAASWRTDALERALGRLPAPRPIVLWGGILLVAIVFAWLAPAPPISPDSGFLVGKVRSGWETAPRWHVLLVVYQGGAALAADWLRPYQVIQVVNTLLGGVALAAIAMSVRALGADRAERLALGGLAFGAFGVLQLCFAYPDVYPAPLVVVALYCWLAIGAVDGVRHPFWPLAVAALGPFVYLGTSILAPSVLVIAAAELGREGGRKRVAWSLLGAVLLAGAATWPFYGYPFAWIEMLDAVTSLRSTRMGLNATGYQVPIAEILSWRHVYSVAHVLLLVDPVGWVLLLGPGVWLAFRGIPAREGRRALLLASIVLPYLAFCFSMDPLYGAYLDWDLFSYGAAATSLLGGYAFVVWGRTQPSRLVGAALGLALALTAVHLTARFNALHMEHDRHMKESPPHLSIGPSGSKPRPLGGEGWRD